MESLIEILHGVTEILGVVLVLGIFAAIYVLATKDASLRRKAAKDRRQTNLSKMPFVDSDSVQVTEERRQSSEDRRKPTNLSVVKNQ